MGIAGRETKLSGGETILRLPRRHRETSDGYQSPNDAAASRSTGDSQMRTILFVLAFATLMFEPSLAGTADAGLPGIGTFSYNGSPVATPAQPMVMAAR